MSTTPSQTVQDGDARLAELAARPGWRSGHVIAGLVAVLVAVWIGQAWIVIARSGDATFPADFRVFWSAAKLAVEGDVLGAFDVSRLADVQSNSGDTWMPWSYPPTFLLILLPLGALSYGAAWAAFTVVSAVAILTALRPFAPKAAPIWLSFALAPAAIPTFFMGQTTLIWIAGLLAALACLRAERFVLAGIFIGFLTFKPQLGLLIPVALLASGAWRTILSASVTTILFAALATLVVGVEYWAALGEMIKTHFSVIRQNSATERLMISQYSVMAGIGIPEGLAMVLQWTLTGLGAIGVALAWSTKRISFDLGAAMLVTAILLSTPYLWYYESYMLVVAALFMLRAGVLRPTPLGLLLTLLIWLGLGPTLLMAVYLDMPDIPVRYLAAALALIAFALCLNACLRQYFAKAAH